MFISEQSNNSCIKKTYAWWDFQQHLWSKSLERPLMTSKLLCKRFENILSQNNLIRHVYKIRWRKYQSETTSGVIQLIRLSCTLVRIRILYYVWINRTKVWVSEVIWLYNYKYYYDYNQYNYVKINVKS